MNPQYYVRTDIANAFNQADRQATFDSLATAHPLLQAGQYAWLRHPTHAVLMARQGARRLLVTDVGIPQGDPLSSLAFALLLAKPLATMNTHESAAVAYADDAVLITAPDHTADTLQRWESLLAPLGLALNRDKLQPCLGSSTRGSDSCLPPRGGNFPRLSHMWPPA